jgi:hypothetical protein
MTIYEIALIVAATVLFIIQVGLTLWLLHVFYHL